MLNINTNLSGLIVQSSLKTSTNGLNQAIERMTTGFKINHAKDNAANFSINTKLSSKISSYQVAEDNITQALNMVDTALESLSIMSGYSNRLRSLAMQVQNGTYGNKSIGAINTEAVSIINELYRTKNNAEYNGISLFGGLERPADITFPDEVKKHEFIKQVNKRDTSAMTTIASLDENIVTTGGTYSISTVEELAKAVFLTRNGKLKSAELVLANNIDVGDWCEAHASEGGWRQMGAITKFDGNGYVIENVTMTQDGSFLGGTYVVNLGLVNFDIKANGGASAFGNSPLVENCFVTGNISGTYTVGALLGEIKGATIKDCWTDANVYGWDRVGGLLGGTNINASFTIENCYTSGSVKGESFIGGMVGGASVRGDMTGKIINCVSISDVEGNKGAGGLIGYAGNTTFVTNCYSTGKVTGTTGVGGLVAESSGQITNSYYNSESSGQSDTGKGVGLSSAELNKLVAKGQLPDFGLDLPLPDIYDTSTSTLYSPSFVEFQVGISEEDSAGIHINLFFTIEGLRDLCYLGLDEELSLVKIDEMLASISAKESELGALQNRLNSALEQVAISYENLVSTQSTIRDADIAEESSAYIRNQILQQASATLLATANQTPSIALQLL